MMSKKLLSEFEKYLDGGMQSDEVRQRANELKAALEKTDQVELDIFQEAVRRGAGLSESKKSDSTNDPVANAMRRGAGLPNNDPEEKSQ